MPINLIATNIRWIISLYIYLSAEEQNRRTNYLLHLPIPRRISNALSPRVGDLAKMLILIQQVWLGSEILHATFSN